MCTIIVRHSYFTSLIFLSAVSFHSMSCAPAVTISSRIWGITCVLTGQRPTDCLCTLMIVKILTNNVADVTGPCMQLNAVLVGGSIELPHDFRAIPHHHCLLTPLCTSPLILNNANTYRYVSNACNTATCTVWMQTSCFATR